MRAPPSVGEPGSDGSPPSRAHHSAARPKRRPPGASSCPIPPWNCRRLRPAVGVAAAVVAALQSATRWPATACACCRSPRFRTLRLRSRNIGRILHDALTYRRPYERYVHDAIIDGPISLGRLKPRWRGSCQWLRPRRVGLCATTAASPWGVPDSNAVPRHPPVTVS